MMLSTFVFLSIYVIFSYMFMAGVAAEMKMDDQGFKPVVRVFAPIYMPYIIGVCLMGSQRVNKRIVKKMKDRQKKEIDRLNKELNENFLKEINRASAAMAEALKPENFRAESIYGMGGTSGRFPGWNNRHPFNKL